jgi:hypothetical protein
LQAECQEFDSPWLHNFFMLIKHIFTLQSISSLIHYVRVLGFSLGIRYYICMLKTLDNPEFLITWADSCDKQARKLEFFNSESEEAYYNREWSKKLRACYTELQKQYNKI